MPRTPLHTLILAGVCLVVVASGAIISGCSGGGADAPTNTANSKYNDTGKTAADIIGSDRTKAHARLPQGGAGNTQ